MFSCGGHEVGGDGRELGVAGLASSGDEGLERAPALLELDAPLLGLRGLLCLQLREGAFAIRRPLPWPLEALFCQPHRLGSGLPHKLRIAPCSVHYYRQLPLGLSDEAIGLEVRLGDAALVRCRLLRDASLHIAQRVLRGAPRPMYIRELLLGRGAPRRTRHGAPACIMEHRGHQ